MEEPQQAEITAAQLAHLRQLVIEREQITKEISRFTDYLVAEYGLDREKKWQVWPNGLMAEVK